MTMLNANDAAVPTATHRDLADMEPWKALSIRQPWATMIIFLGKDCENRTWHTRFRGRFLVHASQSRSRSEWLDAIRFARDVCGISTELLDQVCRFDQLPRGGIIGSVELVDSVDRSESRWYMGEKGFLLRDPQPMPFVPCAGRLGFFNVPREAITSTL
ncbi:TPA: hypothetical protein ACKRQV_001224 [Pseudomonas aeruginosa]